MDQKQQDFYRKLRKKVDGWLQNNLGAENPWRDFILLAPDIFYLLCMLAVDPEVPPGKKVKLGGAIAYFISPIDFLPEAVLGPVGYLDDVAVAAYVLNNIINDVNPQVVARHWAGERDILNLVKTILINSDKMLGSGLWKKIRRKF